MGSRGRVGMGCGAGGSVALVLPECTADALLMPGLPVVRLALEVGGDIAADVGIAARVAGLLIARRTGVVDIPGGLLPGIENHFLVSVVRVQRGDNALGRVVEQDRADAGLHAIFEVMRGAEERLVLTDRLALVIEDGPAAADPAWIDQGAAFHHGSGLGLNLLLNLAAEAVRVGEAELDFAGSCDGSGALACVSRASVTAQAGCHCALDRWGRPAVCGENGQGRRRCALWRREAAPGHPCAGRPSKEGVELR